MQVCTNVNLTILVSRDGNGIDSDLFVRIFNIRYHIRIQIYLNFIFIILISNRIIFDIVDIIYIQIRIWTEI